MAEDYENNPIYDSDIRKIQGPAPTVVFQYEWDSDLGKWVPAQSPQINVDELNIDMNLGPTNEILSGISGQLENLDIDVDLFETNSILSGISGVLEEQGQTNDEETHRVLSGISGVLEEQGQTNDEETHRILSGISGQLDDLDVDVDLDHTNQKLVEIRQAIESLDLNSEIDIGDVTITGDLSDEETHRLLKHIKDSTENVSLSIEELKRNYSDLTYHTKRFGANVNETYNISEEPGVDLEINRKTFNEMLYNAPDNDEETDRENEYIDNSDYMISELTPDYNRNENIGTHSESARFILKYEDYPGDKDGFYKFAPLAKPIGENDRVTIFNDSRAPLELLFRGGEAMKLYAGYKIELTKSESYKLFVRRKYSNDGFTVGYTLERMYTPEKTLFNDIEEHPQTGPENTHQLLTLGSFFTDDKYLYVTYGNAIKRVAIASWETVFRPKKVLYPIDYFDAYSDKKHLYLNFQKFSRRIAIADWEDTSKVPIDANNKVWADEHFMYVKTHGPASDSENKKGRDEWRRYPIASY